MVRSNKHEDICCHFADRRWPFSFLIPSVLNGASLAVPPDKSSLGQFGGNPLTLRQSLLFGQPQTKCPSNALPVTQRAASRQCDNLRRGGRRHSGRYSLSSRPKPSHGSSTANSLRLPSLSLRRRRRPGLSPTSHRNPRSHHHSRTYLRT